MSFPLLREPVLLKPDADYPLHITAARYSPPANTHSDDHPHGGSDHDGSTDALTLVVLHSTSFHKETWEPTLERLFALAAQPLNRGRVRIREAWAIDCPNHGQSAVLNEEALQLPEFRNKFSCAKYAAAVHRFLAHGAGQDPPVDFRQRTLVGLGHSLGGVAITMVQNTHPRLPFSALVLVEPMLSPRGTTALAGLRTRLVRDAYERRDVWRDAGAARRDLGRRAGWDARVVERFVTYGLRRHPGADHPLAPYPGLTLACSRAEEVAMYRDADDGAFRGIAALDAACARGTPVHVVFGERNDYIPRDVQDALVDPRTGRRFAGVARMQGVGHLIPQAAPDALADEIYTALLQDAGAGRRARGKL